MYRCRIFSKYLTDAQICAKNTPCMETKLTAQHRNDYRYQKRPQTSRCWANSTEFRQGNTSVYILLQYLSITKPDCGPGSSVGIATGYGHDGPGIESR